MMTDNYDSRYIRLIHWFAATPRIQTIDDIRLSRLIPDEQINETWSQVQQIRQLNRNIVK